MDKFTISLEGYEAYNIIIKIASRLTNVGYDVTDICNDVEVCFEKFALIFNIGISLEVRYSGNTISFEEIIDIRKMICDVLKLEKDR